MEKDTTYGLSYWEGPNTLVESVRPENNLTCSDAPMSDETTHKVWTTVLFFQIRPTGVGLFFPDELFWQLVRKNRSAYNTLRQAVVGQRPDAGRHDAQTRFFVENHEASGDNQDAK